MACGASSHCSLLERIGDGCPLEGTKQRKGLLPDCNRHNNSAYGGGGGGGSGSGGGGSGSGSGSGGSGSGPYRFYSSDEDCDDHNYDDALSEDSNSPETPLTSSSSSILPLRQPTTSSPKLTTPSTTPLPSEIVPPSSPPPSTKGGPTPSTLPHHPSTPPKSIPTTPHPKKKKSTHKVKTSDTSIPIHDEQPSPKTPPLNPSTLSNSAKTPITTPVPPITPTPLPLPSTSNSPSSSPRASHSDSDKPPLTPINNPNPHAVILSLLGTELRKHHLQMHPVDLLAKVVESEGIRQLLILTKKKELLKISDLLPVSIPDKDNKIEIINLLHEKWVTTGSNKFLKNLNSDVLLLICKNLALSLPDCHNNCIELILRHLNILGLEVFSRKVKDEHIKSFFVYHAKAQTEQLQSQLQPPLAGESHGDRKGREKSPRYYEKSERGNKFMEGKSPRSEKKGKNSNKSKKSPDPSSGRGKKDTSSSSSRSSSNEPNPPKALEQPVASNLTIPSCPAVSNGKTFHKKEKSA